MRGFTLIELMIVIAIIGILAAIAIPQFSNYRQKSLNSTALSDIHNLMNAEEAEFASNQLYTAVSSGTGPAWLFGNTRFITKNVGFNINTNNSGNKYAVFTGYIGSDKEYGTDTNGEILFKIQSNAGLSAQNETASSLSSWGGSSL